MHCNPRKVCRYLLQRHGPRHPSRCKPCDNHHGKVTDIVREHFGEDSKAAYWGFLDKVAAKLSALQRELTDAEAYHVAKADVDELVSSQLRFAIANNVHAAKLEMFRAFAKSDPEFVGCIGEAKTAAFVNGRCVRQPADLLPTVLSELKKYCSPLCDTFPPNHPAWA